MDDDFGGADDDLIALAAAAERSTARPAPPRQPQPQVRAPPTASSNASSARVVQPTPRALPQRAAPSAIIVSTRQKGNPLLTHISALPWEYGDIVPDYVLGATACCLFLSLKYHRLHPEYIYSRIRALGHKYNLRVLLVIVDIDNHEESLRELSKTSLVNDLTLILAWSAREAARYIESYKALEHAAPAAIRGTKPQGYSEQMVEFVTVPRGINRTDAMGMIGAFGSVKAAIGAPLDDLENLQGWGKLKAERWHRAVREPFRREMAKGRAGKGEKRAGAFVSAARAGPQERARLGSVPPREGAGSGVAANAGAGGAPSTSREAAAMGAAAEGADEYEPGADEVEALHLASLEESGNDAGTNAASSSKRPRPEEPDLDAGIAEALAKYRKG
jgi:DNA excision repair protein ERCC-1